MSTPVTFVPTAPVPLLFGGTVACGFPGDELTGIVKDGLYTNGYATMSFYIPTSQSSIEISLCMIQVNSPTNPVVITLKNGATTIATANISPSQVTTGPLGLPLIQAYSSGASAISASNVSGFINPFTLGQTVTIGSGVTQDTSTLSSVHQENNGQWDLGLTTPLAHNHSQGELVSNGTLIIEPTWTQFVTLTPASSMSPGYYNIVITSPLSNSSSYYLLFFNQYVSWNDINATAGYVPPTGSPFGGNHGSPSIWIKDSNAEDLTIFPYGVSGDVSLVGTGNFIAQSSYQINGVAPWLSDMEYLLPPYTANFVLKDTTTNATIGTAPASQYYNSHGIQGIIPFQFPAPVNIVKGHSYSISITETGNASAQSAYPVLVRGESVNPAQASTGGAAKYWLGGVFLSDYSLYRVLDYGGTTTTNQSGHGGIGNADQMAVRIVPNFTETITSVQLKMSNAAGAPPTPGFYPAGNAVTVSLFASNEAAGSPTYAKPIGSAIASASVDSGIVPLVGFFSIPTSFSVTAGTAYWLVWSSPTATTSQYSVERCVSPYRNLALSTQSSGGSWFFFGQGPTDLAFAAIATSEMLGSPYDNSVSVTVVGTTNIVAQPFNLSRNAIVNSIFLGAGGGNIIVNIYPDNGLGTAPNMTTSLGSGTFNSAFSYFYSQNIVPLTSPATVLANTKYWIVITTTGTISVDTAQYWTRPSDPSVPAGYEIIKSVNSGASWTSVASEVASAIFMVGVQPSGIIKPTTTIGQVLASKGINTYSVVAYGQPTLTSAQASYFISQGFKVYPWEDGSNGYTSDLLTTYNEFTAGGGGVIGPTYGWGYDTQFYDLGRGFLATLYPNEQEFYLSSSLGLTTAYSAGATTITTNNSANFLGFKAGQTITISGGTGNADTSVLNSAVLSSGTWTLGLNTATTHNHASGAPVSNGTSFMTYAQSFGINGIVIDAPELVTEWLYEYSQIDSHVGLQNLLGIAGWVNSDHPVNYGGAQGANGGHNMNTYTRYVNSPLGLYNGDFSGLGIHTLDGTTCQLFPFVGTSTTYPATIGTTNTWSRTCFSRVYQTYPEYTATWYWTAGTETPASVATALNQMAPTYVSGLIRIDTDALPLPTSTPNVVGDYNTIRSAVLAAHPTCKFDVVLRGDQYSTGAAIQADMNALASQISFEIFWIDNASSLSTAVQDAAISLAHSLGKLIVADWGQSTNTPETGFDALASSIASVSPVRVKDLTAVLTPTGESGSTLAFLQLQGLPLLLHGDNFSPDRDTFVQTFTLAQRIVWFSTAYSLQRAYGFYLMYGIFGPWQAPINTGYDAVTDGTLTLQSLLVGLPPCEPPASLATDISTYHHANQQSSSFGLYCAASNASLEYTLLSTIQSKTIAFARTAMPPGVLKLVPNYYSSVLETTSSSIYSNSAGAAFLSSGGFIVCCPYFNFASTEDDSSNPGGGFGVASPATTLSFWLGLVPSMSHYPFMEADTDPTELAPQVAATSWGHFGPLYSSMPYVGGWFGFEQNKLNVLIIDHNYGNLTTWGVVGAIARLYGTDSYQSLSSLTLSNFNVILGLPNSSQDTTYAADLALLEAYVTAGGTVIVYSNSGAPSGLTGIGTTAIPIPYPHPILAPYTQADLNTAIPSHIYGYINPYGAGQVITLTAYGYGDGFGVGDATNGAGSADGLSSGLAFLTMNAILWASGEITPALYLPQYVKRTSWANPLNGNGQGVPPTLVITVCGSSGNNLLVWISNTSTSAQSLQLNLNQKFFGTPTSWQAKNGNGGSTVATGAGNVVINVTTPIQDWMPLYIQASTNAVAVSGSMGSNASAVSTRPMGNFVIGDGTLNFS